MIASLPEVATELKITIYGGPRPAEGKKIIDSESKTQTVSDTKDSGFWFGGPQQERFKIGGNVRLTVKHYSCMEKLIPSLKMGRFGNKTGKNDVVPTSIRSDLRRLFHTNVKIMLGLTIFLRAYFNLL